MEKVGNRHALLHVLAVVSDVEVRFGLLASGGPDTKLAIIGRPMEMWAERQHERPGLLAYNIGDARAFRTDPVALGESQISLTVPDSRAMAAHTHVAVGYNIQVAVDAKHKLIVEQQVTNFVWSRAL